MDEVRLRGDTFAARRAQDYLEIRRNLEFTIREKFIAKGGEPLKATPHYMILGPCPWVETWYRDGRFVVIPLREITPRRISFTYGDSFPAMRFQDGKPYRGMVYTLEELPELIHQYGLPGEWNHDGSKGPERYIEAQVWEDIPIIQKEKRPVGV